MVDSVRLEHGAKRPVGGGVNTGRLHKGHGKTAASASIPSKYQTIVTDKSEKKGFLSRSKRFNSEFVGSNPGPGQYGQLAPIEKESSSYSKKGTGGFASKSKRFIRRQTQGKTGPGPGEYESFPHKESYFNRSGVTSTFHLPIAIKRADDKKNNFPAPNQYNLGKQTGRVVHDNNVSAYAAFKSTSKRSLDHLKSSNGPSPSHYSINDKLISDTPKTVSAPFKSTVERKMMKSPLPIPGPGTYDPSNHPLRNNKDIPRGFFNKHYLCISAPAMPLPLPDPSPGPGHYNIVDYEGQPKHFMSSSMFVSSTSRWIGGSNVTTDDDNPGPATYRPHNTGKQSFLYNYNSRWVPG